MLGILFRGAQSSFGLKHSFRPQSVMAALAPPIPSPLASFLCALLPRGFALGPSRLCGGRVGLWWVGRPLEAGSLLGRDGDTEWASGGHTDPTTRSRDGHPGEAEKVRGRTSTKVRRCDPPAATPRHRNKRFAQNIYSITFSISVAAGFSQNCETNCVKMYLYLFV